MFRKTFLIAIAAMLVGAANARTLEIVESAYEAVLAEVNFPGNAAGTLVVRLCASCDPKAMLVSPATVYIGPEGRSLALADFLERVAALRQSADGNQTTAVTVFYDPESNRVTRVSVHAGALSA